MRLLLFSKRMSLLVLVLLYAISSVQAQATYLSNEKFSSKKPSGWDIIPAYSATAPSWKPDTGLCVSTKYAMHGMVPYTTGDTATLVTPFYDCTNYQYVMIRFNHICKVLPSDICRIEYQEDVLGSANKWRHIPYDAYKGGCATYRQDSGFSHSSYSTWADYDTLAKPTNGWWKQETFNVSDYAGYSKVRFRFIIRKGKDLGSFIAAGWYVDDFQVLVSKFELKPPVVQFISDLNDTVYSAGPFVVQAKVATRTLAKIVNPYLAYSITYEGKTKKDSIRMTAIKGDSIWEATIPQQYYGTIVSYSIFGRDANGNNSIATGSFVNKRMKAGKVSGYTYYMPSDTTGATTNNLAIIYHVGYTSSLSRSLYLASEINPKNVPMTFSKLAWYNRSYTTVVTRNIKIWMLATNDVTTVTGLMDPTTSGATLVYNGTTTSQLYWNEVTLQKPFTLPAGKNLYIFYEGNGGTTSSSSIYWAGHSQSSRCTYNYSGSWTGSSMVPLIRLGLGGSGNYDSNSVALASIDNPMESTVAGKQPVKITIQNMGDGYLDYCNVNWKVNGVLQTPKTWKGHLYTDFYDTLTLGSYTQKLMGYDTITVWVSNPNNKVDSVLDDDTLTVIAFGCDSLLKGTYTVGKGAKYNFATLKDAFKLLETCGWGGDVTLKLASGTYTDNMDFNGYKAPSGHRLTITSIAGVADSVVIKPASSPVVTLNNCSGLVFSRIKFDATNVATYCVQLGSGLDDIEFNHCILQGYKSTTSGNAHTVIYKPSGSAISNIRFIGNQILDGSYSIYFYGSGTTAKNRAIVFDSNYIAGFYYYVAYFYYNKMRFTHNVIEEMPGVYSYNYGIYCYYLDSTLIDANRIITHNHSNYQYGLRTYYTDSATVISNNELIMHNFNSGTSYGLYFYYPSGSKMINNSVLMYGSATAYGLYTYMYSTGYWAEIKNNIVACVGSGTNYPLYTSSITAVANYDLNYNCFWSKGMMTYENGSITTLQAHLKNFPNATHDMYMRPSFKDSTKSLELKSTTMFTCPRHNDVPFDLFGHRRVAITTIGAISKEVVQSNGALTDIIDVPNKTYAGDTIRPKVILSNAGLDTIVEATIRVELNNVVQGKDIVWKGKLATGEEDTIALGTFIMKAGDNSFKAYIVKLGTLNDTVKYDDTVSVSTYSCDQPFAGTYTVGATGQYKTITELVDRMMLCGINAPVTISILPGSYYENIVLDAIPGSSAKNTITFTSSTGDSSSVIWERADDAYQTQTTTFAAPLVLNGASHVIVRNLTLTGMAPNTTGGYYYSHGIVVTGSSQDVEVRNCHLYVPKNFTTAVSGTNHCAVCLYQGTVRDVRIHHNLLEGGGTGCYVYGTGTAARVNNVTIEHNEIGYVDYSAIYAYYTDSVNFNYNRVRQRVGNFTPVNAYVTYLYYTNANMLNNTFDFHAIYYGMYSYYAGDTATGYYRVANNAWNGTLTGSTSYGMLIGYDNQMDICNNSLRLDAGASCTTPYGFYCSTNPIWVNVKNNIFHMVGTGANSYPIYIGSSSYLSFMDINYNCYYNEYPTAPRVGYMGGIKTTLAAWKSSVSSDKNSVWLQPNYINSSENLDLLDSAGLTCPTIAGYYDDVLGRKRDQKVTNMGAYNCTPGKLDIAMMEIISPKHSGLTSAKLPVTVLLKNTGTTTITTLSLGYTLNGVAGPAYQWKGSLAYLDTATVTIGSIQLRSNGNDLTVFSFNPNGGKDERPFTDTLSTTIFGCDSAMSGTYSVGTAKSDFLTLQEALNAVNYCGMGGPVTLEIATGQYSEIALENFQAGSDTNILTIRSAARNRDSVIVSGMYPFKLTESSHLRIEDITFDGSVVGVELGGMLEDVEFRHCNIYSDFNVTHTSYRAVNYPNTSGSGKYLKDVRFIGNTIWGGCYNFYLYYMASSTDYMTVASVTIDSNIMGGAYQYAIYSYYYGHYKSISHNTITNGSHANSTFYGMYLYYYHNNELIDGNIIHINHNSTGYGMYLYYYQNYPSYGGTPGTVSNNEIIMTGNGQKYGIYQYEYSMYNIVNNSIYVKGNSTNYAMYCYNSTVGYPVNLVNNILVNDYTSGYALYNSYSNSYASTYGVRDYNNYYSKSGNHAYLNGASKTTIAAIKAVATDQDQHSMVTNPTWLNPGNTAPMDLQIKNSKQFTCKTAYNVKQDILGVPRAGSTAMGCYGLEPDSNDAQLSEFVGVETITSNGTHPVKVVIYNAGINPIDSATITLTVNGVQQKPFMYRPSKPLLRMQSETVTLATMAFSNGALTMQAVVSMKGDTNSTNDTVIVKRLVCSKTFAGNIVIGNSKSADYTIADLGKMLTEMSQCGVSGDITLLIEDGKYTTSTLDLTTLNSIMNGYRLTVTSKSGDRSKVTVSSTSGDLLVLGGNKKLVIRDLTLEASTGNVINIKSNCDSLDILHNHLLAPTTGSTSSYNPIYKASGTGIINGLRIIGNDIEGGYYGMYLYGSGTSALNTDVVIDSNYIHNQYYYGILVEYNHYISLSHNKLRPRTSGTYSTYWYGIYSYYDNGGKIDGNDIDATVNSGITYPYGMYINYLNRYNLTYPATISNNLIRCYTTSSYYGLYCYYCQANVCHNTVLMSGTGSGYVAYNYTIADYPTNYYGNLFLGSKSQYPLYISNSAGIGSMDYNNYYGEGNYIGYYNGAINSLATWQSSTGEDAHSVSQPVDFLNLSNNMKLKSYSPFLMPSLQEVTTDFEGQKRDAITAMGAYTPVFQQLDAALTDFAKTDLSNPAKVHIEVTLANYGKDTLTTAVIEWSINKVQQTAVKWSGKLPQFGTTTVVLGNTALTSGKMTNITAWVTNPNGKKDMEPINDTVITDEFICNGKLAGSYTVGGTTPDFATMEDAITALTSCGVSAPVTLKLRSASLKGLTISGSVPGASSTNTITVMPDGNAKVVFSEPNGIGLTVSNAAHWHFRNLTFGNTTNGLIGVELQGSLEDVSFRHCNIYASTTTTNSTYYAVHYPNSSGSNTYPVDLEFVGNNIQGGYYGMYLYYTAGSTANMKISSITVDSNTIANAYYYGFYSYYYSHYKSISYNYITNRKGSSSYFYALYNYEYSNIEHIEGNRILVQNTSGSYGMYLSYDKNQASYGGKPGVLKNNEVILLGSGSSTIYGIYMYYPYQDWEVVNNSVLARGGSSTVYGLYAYNTSTSYMLTIKNNHFVTYGTSTNYPIYLSTYYTSGYVTLDYNNYYSYSGNYIGYAGAAQTSLSSWQSATGMDAHSVSVRPQFIDSTIDLQLKDYSSFVCPMASSVPVDINGDKRTSHTTMGCHGLELYEDVNLQAVNFVTPQPIADVICYADYTPVSITVKNAGLKEADFTKSPLKVSLDITGAISYHFDTTYTSGSIKFQEEKILNLVTVPTIASGLYNMKITLNDTADKVMEDDTMSIVYKASRVELPYDIDFSTEPNEFVNVTMASETAWKVVKGTGSNPALAPAFGTGRLEFAGAKDPGAYANAVFNAVNIQGCVNPTLSFWYAHNANCSGNDMLTVLVTTDGGANYTEVKRILVADTATAWKQYDIDLSAFTKSSCLSVVFSARSFGNTNQSIDRIRITASQDATISLLPISTDNQIACDNTPVDVKAVITNLSRLNIDMLNDTLTLNVTGAVNYSNKVVYNHRLGSFEADTVTLGQISLDANGAYYFEAYMQPFDDRSANDTITDSTLFIMQDIALDTVLGLDNQMFKLTGETVNVSAIAINNGNISVDKVIMHMSIDGNNVVSDTIRQMLHPGDTLIHPMSKAFTVPAVSKDQPFYFFELKTELGCDADNTNDVINIVGQVLIPDSIDIQVLDITATTPATGKTKLSPTVTVANIGNIEADNIVIHVDVINDSNRVVESISENISHMAVNETNKHAFTMNYKVPNYTGKYTLKAYVETFDGDTIQNNDTLSKEFACYRDSVGIREVTDLDWSLGQNIPNPATEVTTIPFTLPQDGRVRLSVMTTNGQVIYRQEVDAIAGGNRIELDASGWASGLYYYTMEFRGQRITRKMNIAR